MGFFPAEGESNEHLTYFMGIYILNNKKRLSVQRENFNAFIMQCYSCQYKLDVVMPLSRQDTCAKCGRDLRCCMNCRLYREGVYNDCLEPQAERQIDKLKANFCGYFSPNQNLQSSSIHQANSQDEARIALENLFKK